MWQIKEALQAIVLFCFLWAIILIYCIWCWCYSDAALAENSIDHIESFNLLPGSNGLLITCSLDNLWKNSYLEFFLLIFSVVYLPIIFIFNIVSYLSSFSGSYFLQEFGCNLYNFCDTFTLPSKIKEPFWLTPEGGYRLVC